MKSIKFKIFICISLTPVCSHFLCTDSKQFIEQSYFRPYLFFGTLLNLSYKMFLKTIKYQIKP